MPEGLETSGDLTAPVEEDVAEAVAVPETEEISEQDLQDLYEESFAEYTAGQIVKGRVVRVGGEDVVVHIGSKSEGVIPLSEFLDEEIDVNVFVGQEIDVYVVTPENEDGIPVLSRKRAAEEGARAEISRAQETGESVSCRVESLTKGGLRVSAGGMKGFIPFSHSGVRRGDEEGLKALVGTTIRAAVLEVRGKRNLILSRRVLLEKEREHKRNEILANIRPGARVRGKIKNITNYGAFVDLDGVDGLVHVSDLSWRKITHPSQMLNTGEEHEFIVLAIDGEKVSLGLKQISPDPWETAATRYEVGSVHNGKVVGVAKYGVFVELEPGVEGLVHISELSWTKRLKRPTEVVRRGSEIEVKVLGVDLEKRRISLGYRQTLPDPWHEAAEKYPPGTVIDGQVSGLTDFGVFVRLPEGVDGMVHVSDISWTKKVTNPADEFKKGQKTRVVVLEIDPEKHRISLGMKQAEADPWQVAAGYCKVGSCVKVKVVKITDFGIFVELSEGLEGLVHISELSEKRISHPSDVVKEGDEVMMKIIKFDSRKRKLSLSLRQYMKDQEQATVKQYMSGDDSSGSTLGDILGQAIQKKKEALERQRAAAAIVPQEEPAAPVKPAAKDDESSADEGVPADKEMPVSEELPEEEGSVSASDECSGSPSSGQGDENLGRDPA
jgi:small subunit ribosomal protein S1